MREVCGLWYHILPEYPPAAQEIVSKSFKLLVAADILDARPVVRENIERALLNCADPIWPHISKYPAEYLLLGHMIQSRAIFKEALIHCVGKWKLMLPHQRARVGTNSATQNLVLVKLVSIWQLKKKKERDMLGYYPDNLKNVKTDSRVAAGFAPGRVVYATHIFSWIALCLFRQWMAQMISEGASFRAGDGGYILYTAMSKGGDHYLKRAEMDTFYQIFPMTDKAKNIIDNAMNLIKEGMKPFVDILIAKRAQFNDVEYLTNCEVEEKDYPWLQPIDEETVSAARSFMKQFPEFGIWAPPTSDRRLRQMNASAVARNQSKVPDFDHGSTTNTSKVPNDSITYQNNSGPDIPSRVPDAIGEIKQNAESSSTTGGKTARSLPPVRFSTISQDLSHMVASAGLGLGVRGNVPNRTGTGYSAPGANNQAGISGQGHTASKTKES